MTPKRVKEDRSLLSRFQLKMDLSRQREILGLALFAFGGLILLVLLHITPTAISDRAAQFLRVLFGWGAFGLPVLAFIASAFLLRRGQDHPGAIKWGRVFAAEIGFGVLLALLHLGTPTANGAALADGGEGGGFIGWVISGALASALGDIGAGAVLLVLALFTLPAILGLHTAHLRRWSEALASRAEATKRSARVSPAPKMRPPEPIDILPEPADEETEPEGDAEPEPVALARPVFGKPAPAVMEPPKLSHPILTPHRRAHRSSKLPPIEDLLDPSNEARYGEMDADEKKHLIVETLAQFGLEAERFRVAPQYDFTAAPHEGRLHYEHYDWGMSGERFRELARQARGMDRRRVAHARPGDHGLRRLPAQVSDRRRAIADAFENKQPAIIHAAAHRPIGCFHNRRW